MQQLNLDPEEFVEQLPPGVKAAVDALRGLQDKVRGRRRRPQRDLILSYAGGTAAGPACLRWGGAPGWALPFPPQTPDKTPRRPSGTTPPLRGDTARRARGGV